MMSEDNKRVEIEKLKIYRRQGVHSAFTGMHYRSLQKRHPEIWDRLAFEDEKQSKLQDD